MTDTDTARTVTRGEEIAEKWAARLRERGWTVEVTVRHVAPAVYSDGRLMIDGVTFTYVNATKPQDIMTGSFHFGWVTGDGLDGWRATTRFVGGHYYPFAQRMRAISGYKQLRYFIDVYAH